MAKAEYHVVFVAYFGRPRWAVKKRGVARASKTFMKQTLAIVYAKAIAKKKNAELIIHGKDGMVSQRIKNNR